MRKSSKSRKAAISLMIMLIALALFAAVAGLVAWKFNSFKNLISRRFGDVTMDVKNDTVEKSKRAFCKNICKVCCQTSGPDTNCNQRMALQKIEVGDEKIPCSEVIDCNCN